MLSVIIATRDSGCQLVHTLAALVSGATSGLVREVIVADGGSTDETEQVADYAGCVFISSRQTLGARLAAASRMARGEWLMFLTAGAVPGSSWIDDLIAFVQQHTGKAAVFSAERAGLAYWTRHLFAAFPRAEQGLIIAKPLYASLGGHKADATSPERDLLRRIGRSRLTTLRTTITANI